MPDALRFQINNYDTYQTRPSPLDHQKNLSNVPVIRIYGSLGSSGANVVAHVHNYFPYVFIDCLEHDYNVLEDPKHISEVIDLLELALADSYLTRAPGDDDEDDEEFAADATPVPGSRKYIAAVSLCKACPIYGYQVGYRLFYRISVLLPLYKVRLVTLFHDGKANFQKAMAKNAPKRFSRPTVYEAHIPFLMQFLADFNLYGCGWIEVDRCYFRTPVVRPGQIGDLKEHLRPFLGPDNVLNPAKFARIGRSLVEIDINAADILNRGAISQKHLHNDFSELLTGTGSSPPTGEVYLSSLKYMYEDLRYQCRQRSATQAANFHTQEDIGTQIGLGGTEWLNQAELTNLLDYVVSINKTSGTPDPQLFRKRIEEEGIRSFPTAFEAVDIELRPPDELQLNRETDIIRWTDYDLLFLMTSDEASLENPPSLQKKNSFVSGLPAEYFDDIEFSDSEYGDADDKKDFNNENDNNENDANDNNDKNGNDNNDNSGHECVLTSQAVVHHKLDESILFQVTQTQRNKRPYSQTDLGPLPQLQVLNSFIESDVSSSIGEKASPRKVTQLLCNPKNVYEFPLPAILAKDKIMESFFDANLLQINHVDPFYDIKADMPSKPLIFANKRIDVKFKHYDTIELFNINNDLLSVSKAMRESLGTPKIATNVPNLTNWQYIVAPPLKGEVNDWIQEEKKQQHKRKKFKSQIEPPITQTNDYKYSYRSARPTRNPNASFNNLTNFYMEMHASTNEKDLLADPELDEVSFIVYTFDDSNNCFANDILKSGILVFEADCDNARLKTIKGISLCLDQKTNIEVFDSEKSMIQRLLDLVEYFDPDILSGYEVNALSWGYIIERGRRVYDENYLFGLSRCTFKSNGKFGDRWGYTHTSAITINGRYMLNIWRILRSELSLTSYSLENVTYHLLHQALPKILNVQLSGWLKSGYFQDMVFVFNYYQRRLRLILKILDVKELIGKNVEQSRVIGIDFNSNFYRGSQYKVESILVRIAKLENMLLTSPSKAQVHKMKPIECIPLIMEPDSNFYKSPLLVLDFQSLYPSIIIAYNYCYSTLVGKLGGFNQKKNQVGFLKNIHLPLGIVDLLRQHDGITLSPNGYMFVKSSVRRSMLSKMLHEILNARINVKKAIKICGDDPELIKLYNSKQLALKLIANVTYGYTSATFSGRMPNSDISDAIVATGREILSKSIEMIEAQEHGAKVIYGDTDSLFVYLPGKSRADAFTIGQNLASYITKQFPDPVKLKFEKVYHPCVLLSKKRYVGYSYETPDQVAPKFDAKGIETIRRDGIPAQLKLVEKTLRILFDTKNLSLVKNYTLREFYKILINRVSIKDFCFAKEVRHGTYKNEKHLPPGAVIANKMVEKDPRSEPQYRERVPYLVTQDPKKPRIKDRSITPEEFMESLATKSPHRLDFDYYISRVLIPPLERIFNLIGVDVKGWYRELPKFAQKYTTIKENDILNVSSNFIRFNSCLVCGSELSRMRDLKHLCGQCKEDELSLANDLFLGEQERELKLLSHRETCYGCLQSNFGVFNNRSDNRNKRERSCVNGDCKVYYSKKKAEKEVGQDFGRMHLVLGDVEEASAGMNARAI